ncbi:uncharacterized protein PAC_19045 [Phialocephala subalpina]|uniref:Alpha/beta hydrolase fold-3 domain-containing protein n=1 Tax=Phialocephala subalpina TaxID=576137 RepID=A0A1L7XVZ1_9HELO|nr:uncharacterized protein PAC_19045 [Phialocephala subalpina]
MDLQRYLSLLNIPNKERPDENAFPVWAELHGLPPAYLAMDGPDPLRDEGYLYEKLLREARVQARTDHYEMPNWLVQFPDLPTAGRAGIELATGVRWLLQVGKYTL